jgi:hypothetical protein
MRHNATRDIYLDVVTIIGDDCFDNKGNKIAVDNKLIDAKVIELQAEYDAQEYARNREVEYPAIKDQLDYIYHNGVDKWKTDMIDLVKNKYPKE